MPEHQIAPLLKRHGVVNWEYANTAARTGATGLLPADVGKWAKQLDDGSIWELADDSPLTWLLIFSLDVPQNSKSTNYTTVLSDRGKHIYHPASDNNPRTYTIDSNANVPYPIGAAITFVNKINTLTIAIASDTLTWAKDGTTGSRTLAANGMATALKTNTTEWHISGEQLA